MTARNEEHMEQRAPTPRVPVTPATRRTWLLFGLSGLVGVLAVVAVIIIGPRGVSISTRHMRHIPTGLIRGCQQNRGM